MNDHQLILIKLSPWYQVIIWKMVAYLCIKTALTSEYQESHLLRPSTDSSRAQTSFPRQSWALQTVPACLEFLQPTLRPPDLSNMIKPTLELKLTTWQFEYSTDIHSDADILPDATSLLYSLVTIIISNTLNGKTLIQRLDKFSPKINNCKSDCISESESKVSNGWKQFEGWMQMCFICFFVQ